MITPVAALDGGVLNVGCSLSWSFVYS